MLIENYNNINSLGSINNANYLQQLAQQKCWRMLAEANLSLEINLFDVVEIWGEGAGAHTALLARQYPAVGFEAAIFSDCNEVSRLLWITDDVDLDLIKERVEYASAIIISHTAAKVNELFSVFDGFARIAAKRNFDENSCLSIYGKGLMRDIFKPRIRGYRAA